MDVKNGEPIPRKSILKSRSRENSVCSDTSESSAADFDERRMIGRSFSHDEATHSDTSDGITEEDSPTAVPLHPASRFEVSDTFSFCSSRCLCCVYLSFVLRHTSTLGKNGTTDSSRAFSARWSYLEPRKTSTRL